MGLRTGERRGPSHCRVEMKCVSSSVSIAQVYNLVAPRFLGAERQEGQLDRFILVPGPGTSHTCLTQESLTVEGAQRSDSMVGSSAPGGGRGAWCQAR